MNYYFLFEVFAEGGTRTHTPLQEADFKSAASTIPPPRPVKKAASGFEPLHRGFADPRLNHLATPPYSSGAEDGIRTRDLLLGKEAFYR